MKIELALATLLAAAAVTPVLADGTVNKIITSTDRQRLDGYVAIRKEALAEAAKDGDPVEFAALNTTLNKQALPFNDFDLTGTWQCRTTKVGKILPLVVYSWFKCRVTDDGSGWKLEKISGSQKTTGRFYTDSDTRLTYLGVGHNNDEKAPAYGRGPASDQVGYAFRTGPKEWRIEFPSPTYESKLDILEFRR
jgi:hypothetical protein